MSTETPELDTELKSRAVALLLAEATTAHEINAVTRTALRAGFMWRCHPCKRDHCARTEKCGCAAQRPADLS